MAHSQALVADGTYYCAGCDTPLYDSDHRFETGCGWPTFYTCLPGAVRERLDGDGMRMELLCNACNGHLGHIFRGESWPLPPPAERHSLNGRSLTFRSETREAEGEGEAEEEDDVDVIGTDEADEIRDRDLKDLD